VTKLFIKPLPIIAYSIGNKFQTGSKVMVWFQWER